jgi:ferric-dicitrate binding protein FerR (iron transport regulator)
MIETAQRIPMIQFLQRSGLLPGNLRRPPHGSALNDAVDKEAARIQAVDPDTPQQWLRLKSALTQHEGAKYRTSTRLVPRLAFGLVLVAAIVGAYLYFTPRQAPTETFTTQKGQQTHLILQDSSEVTLNYASELVVRTLEPGKPRLLSLKGEAFFRVRQNQTPFIVSTEHADVQVVGTEFNVRAREKLLEVAVLRGTVEVSTAREGENRTLALKKNQRALCIQNGLPERIDDIPSPEYPGWTHGKLFMSKTSFKDACHEIEMRFDIAIAIDDSTLPGELITGTLDARTAEVALSALCGLTGKKFRFDGQVHTMY